MIRIDMSGRSVLITGGTKGIGLAAALEFGEAGARTYLTYKWGSDDFSPLYDRFAEKKAEPPVLIRADAAVAEDTDALLETIKKSEERVDFFISNVGVAQRARSLKDYRKRSLYRTLDYSAWPLIEYTKKIQEVFGHPPERVIGISSDGPDRFYSGYDYVAASKTLLEFFAKYMSVHLFNEGSRVNILRFGPVNTESFSLVFGKEFFDYLEEQGVPENMFMTAEECGKAVLAFCSGLLEAVNGQIITVDKGISFRDNLMNRYLSEREKKKKGSGGKA